MLLTCVKEEKPRAVSMRLATTPSLACASAYLTESKRVARAADLVSGLHAKLRCWHPLTRKLEEATETDA